MLWPTGDNRLLFPGVVLALFWSPDSTTLVLAIQDEKDQDGLVVVPIYVDEPLVIADGEERF